MFRNTTGCPSPAPIAACIGAKSCPAGIRYSPAAASECARSRSPAPATPCRPTRCRAAKWISTSSPAGRCETVFQRGAARAAGVGAGSGAAKDEIGRPDNAQPGPEVIQLERLFHIKERERHKHGQGDHLLQDLELPQ